MLGFNIFFFFFGYKVYKKSLEVLKSGFGKHQKVKLS